MPRFFFDFLQGADRCPDGDGVEFADVEQAYLEAVKGSQDMWSELLRQRCDPRQCAFEVRDERREILFVLPFQEVMDNCVDRAVPLHSFDNVAAAAHHTKGVSEEFIQTLYSVRQTLEQSRALLRARLDGGPDILSPESKS
jgi:hypothetical protein